MSLTLTARTPSSLDAANVVPSTTLTPSLTLQPSAGAVGGLNPKTPGTLTLTPN